MTTMYSVKVAYDSSNTILRSYLFTQQLHPGITKRVMYSIDAHTLSSLAIPSGIIEENNVLSLNTGLIHHMLEDSFIRLHYAQFARKENMVEIILHLIAVNAKELLNGQIPVHPIGVGEYCRLIAKVVMKMFDKTQFFFVDTSKQLVPSPYNVLIGSCAWMNHSFFISNSRLTTSLITKILGFTA